MDLENSEKLVQKVLDVVSTSGSYAVEEYTAWFVASAIAYIILGCVICYLSFTTKTEDEDGRVKMDGWLPVIKWLLFVIGMLFIAENVPDLFAPKGAAIHQLIKDVKN